MPGRPARRGFAAALGEALHLIRRAVVNKQDSCVIDGFPTNFAEVKGASSRCVLPVGREPRYSAGGLQRKVKFDDEVCRY